MIIIHVIINCPQLSLFSTLSPGSTREAKEFRRSKGTGDLAGFCELSTIVIKATLIPIINNDCRWGEAFRTPLSQPQLKGCGSKWLNKERWGMLLFFYSHTLYKVTAILTQMTKSKGRLDKERNTQIWIMWSKTKLWGWTLFVIFPKICGNCYV